MWQTKVVDANSYASVELFSEMKTKNCRLSPTNIYDMFEPNLNCQPTDVSAVKCKQHPKIHFRSENQTMPAGLKIFATLGQLLMLLDVVPHSNRFTFPDVSRWWCGETILTVYLW